MRNEVKMTAVECESCSIPMSDWAISANDTLDYCETCQHIQRNMTKCLAGARDHAWGGVGLFDKVRSFLTLRSLKKKLDLQNTKEPLSILDIGFGAGLLLKYFVENNHNCAGIEAELLEVPHAKMLQEKAKLSFSNAEDADFGENLDLIYAIHVIEHLQAPQYVFEKCAQALKKGGQVYFMTPNAESSALKIFKDKWWNLEDPTHIRFFSQQSVNLMLEKAGFTDVKVTIPRWDSLTIEANSVMRAFSKSSQHGVLSGKLGLLAILALFPFFLLLRFPWRKISPSIEITATKA